MLVSDRGIHNIVRLQIKRPGSSKHDWEEIEIPHNIRAIVVLNLQSYAGGRKPWGHPSENTMKKVFSSFHEHLLFKCLSIE